MQDFFLDICPWTLSVPRCLQFSESEARRIENCEHRGTQKCSKTNIGAFFQSDKSTEAIVFIICQIVFAIKRKSHSDIL